MRIQHVALHVPDLREAEGYYRAVFDLEVVSREALVEGDLTDNEPWRQLPHEFGWDDAALAGIDIRMVGLRRDDLIFALFPGAPQPGTVLLIGLVATAEEIGQIRDRLPAGTSVEDDTDDALTFVDPWGFRWQLAGPGFRGPGDANGRWLDMPQ